MIRGYYKDRELTIIVIYFLESSPFQPCQSSGNNSDPERFASSINDASTHGSIDGNGLRDLQPVYIQDIGPDRQLQINKEHAYKDKTKDVSDIQLRTQAVGEKVHSGNHQRDFCSGNSVDASLQYLESQGQPDEIYSFEDHNNTASLTPIVEHGSNFEQPQEPAINHNDGIVVNTEVPVSECDDNDGDANQPSSASNIDFCDQSRMLMASQLSTAGMYAP